jgi:hypothetical protein
MADVVGKKATMAAIRSLFIGSQSGPSGDAELKTHFHKVSILVPKSRSPVMGDAVEPGHYQHRHSRKP